VALTRPQRVGLGCLIVAAILFALFLFAPDLVMPFLLD
jgi:hypothetical protein